MSFSISTFNNKSGVPGTTDLQVQTPEKPQDSGGTQTVTLTMVINREGVTGDNAIKLDLEFPLVGPEDINLNELEQACKKLGLTPHEVHAVLAGALKAMEMAEQIADLVATSGEDFLQANGQQFAKLFERLEEMLNGPCTQLFDLINSGTYPDFTEFLKLMLETAQNLRQIASECKLLAANGQYDLLMDQAANMKTIADKNHESALKQIAAETTQAAFSLFAGCISFAGALGGLSSLGQISISAGGALSGIFEAVGSLAGHGMKTESTALKKAAEYLEAANKMLEAENKKIEHGMQVADELKEVAKSLQDMVLKLFQDFISAQQQIIQRSNI